MREFNVVQMPEINSRFFRVIEGQVSASGHILGSWYRPIAENLDIEVARSIKTELGRAQHAGAVSFKIFPCFESEGDLVPQEFGPDVDTEFWCVYFRTANGELELVDDFATESDAWDRAELLSSVLNVELEPDAWAEEDTAA